MKLLQKYLTAGAFLMSLAFGIVSWASNLQALSPMYTYQGVLEQTVACYHKMLDGSGMAQCGLNGCKFPSGIVCTPESCYDSAGATVKSPTWSEMLSKYDPVCLDSSGNPAWQPPDHTICIDEAAPVCGDDGITYSNECWAQKAGVGIKSYGRCEGGQMCPTVWDPVCGNDNVTYGNDCEANGAGVGIQYRGECHPEGGDEQCLKDAANHLENSRRDIQNRDRELRDLSRSGAEVGSVKGLLDQWKNLLNEMERVWNQKDCGGFWQLQQDKEQDIRWQVDDAFSKLYGKNQLLECKRRAEEQKQFLDRDKKRTLEEHRRQGRDVSRLEKIWNDQYAMVAKAFELLKNPDIDPRDCDDILQEASWLEQDFWDENDKLNKEGWGKELFRQVKERRQSLKDKTREIKNHQREGRNTVKLEGLYQILEALVTKMEATTDPEALEELFREYGDSEQDFWDLNRELWQEQQDQEIFRIIKEKQQMVKQMTRECERNVCEGEAKLTIEKIQSLLVKMEKVAQAKDFPGAWELNQEIDFISRDFWDSFQKVNEKKDLKRWLKDIEREVMKDMPRWLKDVCREQSSPLCERAQDYLGTMQAIYQKAKEAFEAGDYQATRDLLQFDGDEARQKFNEVMQQIQGQYEHNYCFDELGNMNGMLDMATDIMKNLIEQGEVEAKAGQLCLSYIDRGRSLMSKLKNACEQGDDSQEEFWNEMDQLGGLVSQDCPELMQQMEGVKPPHGPGSPMPPPPQFGPDIENFTRQYFEEENFQDIANQIFERVLPDVMRRVMDHLANNAFLFEDIVTNLTEQLAGRFEEHLANAAEALTFIPEEYHQEFLNEKRTLMEQVNELENTIAQLEAKKISLEKEINHFQEKLASRNLIGDAADEMQEAVAAFIQRASRLNKAEAEAQLEDLEDLFEEVEEDSLVEKFSRGMVPFADTDDWQWYTIFAAQAKEEGFVKGTGESGGTEFNPEGITNVAEACTMFGRVVGMDPDGQPNSALGKRMPEWARPGCAALEERGVDLDAIFGAKKPGDGVTRGEAARLLHLVFDLTVGDLPRFTDMELANEAERDAISGVFGAGIMTGYEDGSGQFGVRDLLNRAAMAKLISKGMEQLRR